MVKVVLWDIDGTLLDFQAAEQAAIRACFRKHGLGACSDVMLKDYAAINRRYWERLERGELEKREVLVERFREFFGKYGLPQEAVTAFNDSYQLALGDTACFHEHGLEIVTALRGTVRQVAVTNGTKIAQQRKLRLSGLDQLLDGIFISEDLGAEKPSPAFFDAVLAKIGNISRAQAIIVGDSLTSDILGGRNAGIRTCWYRKDGTVNDTGVRPDYEIHDLAELLPLLSRL
ncbi:MAG: noncanonical pyrimidine nucleotidase, YjjG family [Ruminococcaceae bacterium]|nr:noncanonical pyrimidine nucleotidase, YjjG family [Oscillospiraceae bacterium]